MAASFKEKKRLPCGIKALGLLRDSVDIELTIIGARCSHERRSLSAEIRIPAHTRRVDVLVRRVDQHS
jgi:hypothetical protein